MIPKTIIPKPWWQVGLTLLPGLLYFTDATFNSPNIRWFSFIVFAVLLLSVLWRILWRQTLSEFPVWGIIPLGILAFGVSGLIVSFVLTWSKAFSYMLGAGFLLGILSLSVLIITKHLNTSHIPAITWQLIIWAGGVILFQWFVGSKLSNFISWPDWILMAVLVLTGLLLAKEHGLGAVMLILPGGVFMMTFDVEPGIYFWDVNRFWNTVFSLATPLLFYVITPCWILRARSLLGQAAGLLIPIIIYYVTLVSTLSLASVVNVSNGYTVMKATSIAEPVILLFLVVTFTGSLYGWISQ